MLKCFSNVRYKYFFPSFISQSRQGGFLAVHSFFWTEQGLSSRLCLLSLFILGVLLSDDI